MTTNGGGGRTWTEGEAEVGAGAIRYREAGAGRPLLFVHGALVDGSIWDGVAERLADRFRCIVPDLPLGSHRRPMRPGADLSPPAQARFVSELIGRLDADGAILVGNDTGGAICQMAVTRHPDGIAALVLTNCDTFEDFPPGRYRWLFGFAALPGGLWTIAQSMRIPANRRSPLAYGPLTKRRIDDELLERWVTPVIESAEVRRDTTALIRGANPSQTMEAARRLPEFDRPTLFAWAPEDRLFRVESAERLAASMPDARVVRIPDARTFVMLDQPERLANEIASFAA
jgi:pimeloyl-ACP methyl ester carboxylesterase